MSDEQQRRGDAERGGSEPDETRLFGPAATEFDPAATGQIQPDDGPRSGDAWILDHTEQMPRPDTGGDETVLAPRADATSVMPAVAGDPGRSEAAARAAAGQNDAWSGRAEVRSPRPGQGGDFTGEGWDGEPPEREPRGKWWLPIVIGIAVLVLLAVLGVGVWLIAKNSGSDDGTPAPTSTATATTAPTTEATTTPPTTAPTTTTTTEPAEPAEVTVPALKGLSSADARQALDRSGLAYRLRFVTSTDADPGTVIDCDPAEGEQVPSDTTVTLIIAAAPSSSPTVSPTPSTTAPTDTNNQPAGN
jgi:hypothetical protein